MFFDGGTMQAQIMPISARGKQENYGNDGHGLHPALKRVLPWRQNIHGKVPKVTHGIFYVQTRCVISVRLFQEK
jgi:hypothetical protein